MEILILKTRKAVRVFFLVVWLIVALVFFIMLAKSARPQPVLDIIKLQTILFCMIAGVYLLCERRIKYDGKIIKCYILFFCIKKIAISDVRHCSYQDFYGKLACALVLHMKNGKVFAWPVRLFPVEQVNELINMVSQQLGYSNTSQCKATKESIFLSKNKKKEKFNFFIMLVIVLFLLIISKKC